MVSKTEQLPQYQRLVDGLVLPVHLGGHTALDFCNTRAGWGSEAPLEYLATYAHLLAFARGAGIVSAGTAAQLVRQAKRDPAAAAHVLGRAHALREALYTACAAQPARGAWDAVAAEARLAAAASRLDPAAPPGRRWRVPPDAGLDVPLFELARSAAEFLADVELGHVRRCPGSGCGWLFLDARGRRRWCTMAVCGNRAKARRHAERARHAKAGR